MASKFQFITELYRATLAELTGDYESWAGFLRAACYNYKCPFDEQVLIYAQLYADDSPFSACHGLPTAGGFRGYLFL